MEYKELEKFMNQDPNKKGLSNDEFLAKFIAKEIAEWIYEHYPDRYRQKTTKIKSNGNTLR